MCGDFLLVTTDVTNTKSKFEGFLLINTPLWQEEYRKHCAYCNFYHTILKTGVFVYVLWDMSYGKIKEIFAALFWGKS